MFGSHKQNKRCRRSDNFDIYVQPVLCRLCDIQNAKHKHVNKCSKNSTVENTDIKYRNTTTQRDQICALKPNLSSVSTKLVLDGNKIDIAIHNVKVSALIDTGAAISVVDNTLVSQLEHVTPLPISGNDITFCTLADGTSVNISHKVLLNVTLGTHCVQGKFYVLPQLHISVIIGCDMLKHMGAVIDFTSGHIKITNEDSIAIVDHDQHKVAYLGGLTVPTSTPIHYSTTTSELLEPKTSKRILLRGDKQPSDDDIYNKEPYVNEEDHHVSISIKHNEYITSIPSQVVAIAHNDSSLPKCILAGSTVMTLDYPKNIQREEEKSYKVDLSEADLNETQKQQVRLLLSKYEDVFAETLGQIGCTSMLTYDVPLKPNAKPIRMKPYKNGWLNRDAIEEQVEEWLECGIIKPSMSEWSFPCLLVPKKGTTKKRLVVDFRHLNMQSELPSYPLIDIDEFLCDLGSHKSMYYTTLDLKNAYLQVPLTERSQKLCSFVCSSGQYSFLRAPFGLNALPLAFARLIDEVLRGIKHKFTQSFIDDILVYSKTFVEHLEHIAIVLQRLRDAGLTVEPRKTHIAKKELVFIGFKFSKNGVKTDPSNIDKVEKFPTPKSVRDVRSFLGLCNYYRRFVKSYADTARPLNQLLKKSTTFEWSTDANDAFLKLRNHLITTPILAYPELKSDEPLRLTTDASLYGTGYILSQKQYDHVACTKTERVISYGSRNFTEAQQKYTVTERELLAVVFAIEKLDQFLRCRKFILITDHSSLQWLLTKKLTNINARLARWVLALSQYTYTVVHRPGTSISNADCLSRQQFGNASEDVSFVVEPYMNAIAATTKEDKTQTDTTCTTKMLLPGLQKLSVDNLRNSQENDYWFGAMKQYITKNILPSSKKLAQRVVASEQDYLVINDVLYHIWDSKTPGLEPAQQLCITSEYKHLIWKAMHELPNAGHMGVTKTYTKVRSRYYWPKMSSETSDFVHNCNVCAEANKWHQPKIPLNPLPVPTGPLERIHIDLLSIAVPSQGYKYILVIICAFSKYVIAKPLKNKTSKTVAKAFFQHYILTFGIPAEAFCTCVQDNGGEFVAHFNRVLQCMLGINSVFITPYSPSSNGMVEITNRTILSILRRLAMKEASKWVVYLPYAVMALNSAYSETTGFSPFELLHGVPMRETIDLQIMKPNRFVTRDYKIAYDYWSSQIKKLRSIGRDRLLKSKKIQKHNFDTHAKPCVYKLGDTVYLKRCAYGLTEDPKIRPMYTGPYVIQRFLSPSNVILVHKQTLHRLPRSYHINKLKHIKMRKITTPEPAASNKEKTHVEPDTHTNNTQAHLPIPIMGRLQPTRIYELPSTSRKVNIPKKVSDDESDGEDETDNIQHNHNSAYDEDTEIEDNNDDDNTVNEPADSSIQVEMQSQSNDDSPYYPISKIHRKRATNAGEKEYYVSWRDRPKRDNCWIAETNLTPTLQERASNLKIPESKPRE